MTPFIEQYYDKSIRIAPDGFSFFKQNGKKMESVSFSYADNTLITNEAPRFFNSSDEVTVIAARHIPMLIPEEIYDSSRDKEYLELQFDTSHVGKIYSEKNGSYRAVYFLTKNEKDTLGRLPFRFQTTSENSLFYRFLCQQKSNDTLFVSCNPGFTDVVAVRKGEILMTNRFQLVEPADTLYYIYNIVTQFHLQSPSLYIHFFAEDDKKLAALLKSHNLNPNIV
jgi:hypothetical protein